MVSLKGASSLSGRRHRQVDEVGVFGDDRLGYLGEQSVVVSGVGAHLYECLVETDVSAFSEDAFGLFNQDATVERALQFLGDYLAVS